MNNVIEVDSLVDLLIEKINSDHVFVADSLSSLLTQIILTQLIYKYYKRAS